MLSPNKEIPSPYQNILEQISSSLRPVSQTEEETQAEHDAKAKVLQDKLDVELLAGNIGAAINILSEFNDYEHGIYWQQIKITGEENIARAGDIELCTIRDARHVKVDDYPNNGYYEQARMILNYLRAAKKLIEIEGQDQEYFEDHFNLDLKQIVNSLKAAQNGEKNNPGMLEQVASEFNARITKALADALHIPFKEANKRLNKAKDFVNLEDPACHVVTVSAIPGQSDACAIEADLALPTVLTEKQQAEYKDRKQKLWYSTMPEWKRKLVDTYYNHGNGPLANGKHVLPTQLRDCTLGIRNAGVKVTAVQVAADVRIHAIHHHMGTIAYLGEKNGKRENLWLTKLNAQQIKIKMFGGNSPHFLTLNSEFNPTGDDREIVLHTKEAMRSVGGLHSNLAFNLFRLFSSNRYHGVEHNLVLAANKFLITHPSFDNLSVTNKNLLALTEYLKGNFFFGAKSKRDECLKYINQLIDSKSISADEAKYLRYAINCRYEIMQNRWFLRGRDRDNHNLTVGALTINFDAYINNMPGYYPTVTACQSGKDRNGILLFETTVEAILSDPRLGKINRNAVIVQQARGAHQAFMSGNLGGGIGNRGIKSDSRFAIPKRYPSVVSDLLIQQEAKKNKGVSYKIVDPIGKRIKKKELKPFREEAKRQLKDYSYNKVWSKFFNKSVINNLAKTMDIVQQILSAKKNPFQRYDDFLQKLQKLSEKNKHLVLKRLFENPNFTKEKKQEFFKELIQLPTKNKQKIFATLSELGVKERLQETLKLFKEVVSQVEYARGELEIYSKMGKSKSVAGQHIEKHLAVIQDFNKHQKIINLGNKLKELYEETDRFNREIVGTALAKKAFQTYTSDIYGFIVMEQVLREGEVGAYHKAKEYIAHGGGSKTYYARLIERVNDRKSRDDYSSPASFYP